MTGQDYGSLYITTGPICEEPYKTIGENKVVIPTHFYKTILIYNDSIKQGIGFAGQTHTFTCVIFLPRMHEFILFVNRILKK